MNTERKQRLLIKVAKLPRFLANLAKKQRAYSAKTPRIEQHLRGRDAAKDIAKSPVLARYAAEGYLPITGKKGKRIKARLPPRAHLKPQGPQAPLGSLVYDTSATHGGRKRWRPASDFEKYPLAQRLRVYKTLKHEGSGPQTILAGDGKSRKRVGSDFRWGAVAGTKSRDWGTQTPGTKYIKDALKSSHANKGWFRNLVPMFEARPAVSPTEMWARLKTKELRAAGAPAFKTQLPPKRSVFQRTKARLFPPPKALTPAEMQATLRPPAITPAGERNLLRQGLTPEELGIGGHRGKRYVPRHTPPIGATANRYGGSDLPKDLQKRLREHERFLEKAQALRERKEASEISPQLNRYLAGEAHKKLVGDIRRGWVGRAARDGQPVSREDLVKYYKPKSVDTGGAGSSLLPLLRLFLGG